MTNVESTAREQLVLTMRQMADRGLNRGAAGNASLRFGDGLMMTPSGVPADALTPESMVRINAAGETPPGALKPSSEWRMHAGILARRADLDAVVHCHSRYATVLACAHRPIPALHYMVALSGGPEVLLAPYHPFGSEELAAAVVETLAGRYACLMANHGQIAGAVSLARAVAIAEEVEEQAAVYCGTLAIGGPSLLSAAQMDDVQRRFAEYGQKRST